MSKLNIRNLLSKEYKKLYTVEDKLEEIDYPSYIKKIREKHNMTQRSFAHALGVSPNTVEKWEMNINKVNNAAKRLLYLLSENPYLMDQLYSVKSTENNMYSKALEKTTKIKISQAKQDENLQFHQKVIYSREENQGNTKTPYANFNRTSGEMVA